MYCINCGVKLGEAEKACPLCGTKVYHPELPCPAGKPLYPADRYPQNKRGFRWMALLLAVIYAGALLTVLLCDLRAHGAVTWSGYVIGAMLAGYVIVLLPGWFRKLNPVIFVPCGFGAVGLYLLYVDLATAGGWFLSFAFPVTGGICLIVTAVVTLLRYVRRGKLFILGGACVALGGMMLLMEFLLMVTFRFERFTGWSLYPLLGMTILGGILIFLGICRPAREAMERKLFF